MLVMVVFVCGVVQRSFRVVDMTWLLGGVCSLVLVFWALLWESLGVMEFLVDDPCGCVVVILFNIWVDMMQELFQET